jgi:hypothetical protein
MLKQTTMTEPAREVTYTTTVCDLCGQPCGYHETGDRAVRISSDLRREYCDTETTHVDCCSACYDAQVLPALVALGFTPREEW